MNQPVIHTERLIIRAIVEDDAPKMFEMDSNPNVVTYLGMPPVVSIEETLKTIEYTHRQYQELGLARWAVEEKSTGEFVGWTGFKLHKKPVNGMIDFIDLGYRFLESAWGKGYATETSIASLKYAFNHWAFDPIYGMAETEHDVSNHILQKMGMKKIDTFSYDGDLCNMYAVSKEEWTNLDFNKNN